MLTQWKSMVLPILDNCSQLWSPSKVGEIQQIEEIQKNFTRKIKSNRRDDYWNRLKTYHLYSLQRRRERYRIIYVWKILEGLVPNLAGRSELRPKTSLRYGRMCSLPPRTMSASSRLQSLRDGSFGVNGPQLFNSLPPHLRNLTGIETLEFKKELDKFLLTVADEPFLPGYLYSWS